MTGLTPHQEAAELARDPLPVLEEDLKDLPTRIAEYDDFIRMMEEDLGAARRKRAELMDRAIAENRLEDEYYRIIFRERKNRILDVAMFRQQYPAAFNAICELERNRLTEALQHVGERITLGMADQAAGKEQVNSVCRHDVEKIPVVEAKQ